MPPSDAAAKGPYLDETVEVGLERKRDRHQRPAVGSTAAPTRGGALRAANLPMLGAETRGEARLAAGKRTAIVCLNSKLVHAASGKPVHAASGSTAHV